MYYYIGIDIGSTSAKTAVLNDGLDIEFLDIRPSGWSSMETANDIEKLLSEKGYLSGGHHITATGYGRICVPFADKTVTEITCHAKGACYIFGKKKTDIKENSLLVVDIGGQDTKIISVSEGKVRDFLMNDKCSAGTGRFIEVMCNSLGVDTAELCRLAGEGRESLTKISSMCTVFAQSEITSLIAKGEKKENIAYAIIDSIADKVSSQAGKLHTDYSDTPKTVLTGGLCECDFLREVLEIKTGKIIETSPEARYAGAIGAALAALKQV